MSEPLFYCSFAKMHCAEVRPHGEWERKSFYDSTPICSECGIEGRWDFEYCPYCGADMRKEGDEK